MREREVRGKRASYKESGKGMREKGGTWKSCDYVRRISSKIWNTINGSTGLAPVNQFWGHNLRLINVVNEMRNWSALHSRKCNRPDRETDRQTVRRTDSGADRPTASWTVAPMHCNVGCQLSQQLSAHVAKASLQIWAVSLQLIRLHTSEQKLKGEKKAQQTFRVQSTGYQLYRLADALQKICEVI